MKNEKLTKQLAALLADRVSDRLFETISDAICEELDYIFNEQTPEWVKALPEDEQLELQYDLAQRVVLTAI